MTEDPAKRAESPSGEQQLENERLEILRRAEEWLEIPMLVLGFAWLLLLVIEFTRGLTPFLETLGLVIWIIFILDFLVKFTLAPRKLVFLKSNWLTEVSLIVPALRVFRIFRVFRVLRAARAVRGLRLVRFVTSLNRGMKAMGASLGRRGFGYVIAVTLMVVVSGAAGMFALENDVEGGFGTYGDALWWTAMLLTSIGSEYWPQTAEGRVLCVVLSVYGFAFFGYITATLATFFIGRDADHGDAELAGARDVRALHAEILALRTELERSRNDGKVNT